MRSMQARRLLLNSARRQDDLAAELGLPVTLELVVAGQWSSQCE